MYEQPYQSVAFEELLKVVTCAVAMLNLEWLDEKRQVTQSKLDDRYLTSGREQPSCRYLLFFPDCLGLGRIDAGHLDILYCGRYAQTGV